MPQATKHGREPRTHVTACELFQKSGWSPRAVVCGARGDRLRVSQVVVLGGAQGSHVCKAPGRRAPGLSEELEGPRGWDTVRGGYLEPRLEGTAGTWRDALPAGALGGPAQGVNVRLPRTKGKWGLRRPAFTVSTACLHGTDLSLQNVSTSRDPGSREACRHLHVGAADQRACGSQD